VSLVSQCWFVFYVLSLILSVCLVQLRKSRLDYFWCCESCAMKQLVQL